SVLAPADKRSEMEDILFRETATFGIRRSFARRTKLQREACTVNTPWGPIQGKRGWRQGHPAVFSPEYEDCARVARQHAVPLRHVYAVAQQAYSAMTNPEARMTKE